jgi:hypothetical protein
MAVNLRAPFINQRGLVDEIDRVRAAMKEQRAVRPVMYFRQRTPDLSRERVVSMPMPGRHRSGLFPEFEVTLFSRIVGIFTARRAQHRVVVNQLVDRLLEKRDAVVGKRYNLIWRLVGHRLRMEDGPSDEVKR